MREFAVTSVLALAFLSGCASSTAFVTRPADEVRTSVCEQRSPQVFAIAGRIDAELATCVRQTLADSTTTLVLDSMGGSVEAALDIGDLLQDRQLTMRVDGECNSSCANYFLPLAKRIELSPTAIVLLHGGMDPGTIERWRSNRVEFEAMKSRDGDQGVESLGGFDNFLALAEQLALRQKAFAERNRINPAWLLYRNPGLSEVSGLSRTPRHSGAILVEEPMMRSCLPNVEVVSYQETLSRYWLRSHRRIGLIWARVAPSGSSICVEPRGSPA